ncbi:MAG: flagellar FliJ family protein, partial [Planctomycetota bacterium]
LHYHEQWKLAEIAACLGQPVSWVKVTLHRARKRLARLLDQRGQRAVLELAAAEQQVAAARETLRTAIAARRAIELLEERERAVWKKRLQKLEDAEMDDLSSRRVFDRSLHDERSMGEGVAA